MSDIYKQYNKLEQENYKLEQRIYHLEWEIQDGDVFERVDKKMEEQFGKEEE